MPNREELSNIERAILEAFEEVPDMTKFFDSDFDLHNSEEGQELMDDMWEAHERLYGHVQHVLFDLHRKGFIGNRDLEHIELPLIYAY